MHKQTYQIKLKLNIFSPFKTKVFNYRARGVYSELYLDRGGGGNEKIKCT